MPETSLIPRLPGNEAVLGYSLLPWYIMFWFHGASSPSRFIPVPVVGSSALLKRMKHQEQECKQHQSRLEVCTL